MLLLSFRLKHGLSKHAVSDAFNDLHHIFSSLGVPDQVVLRMARDPRTYEKVIPLEVQEEPFSICPKCCTSYPLNTEGLPQVRACTSRGPSADICNTPLCKVKRGKLRPVLVFRYRKLDDWIRHLLIRPGIEERLNDTNQRAQLPFTGVASDIWGSRYVREMKGPNGDFLLEKKENEVVLLFSLAVDWFNPHHNLAAGQSVSTGIMFMSCLNLPPEDRYKQENIYLVGVLPGRDQQSVLDDLLSPLISDLLLYWEGLTFVGLQSPIMSTLVRCALVQLVCDVPAARKVAGFQSHNATHPCSVCFISSKELNNLDIPQGPSSQRTKEDHFEHASRYKALVDSVGRNAAEREIKSTAHGVRWSALNALPYWDPVECTVIDVMHLVLLGMCQFHWRKAWKGDLFSNQKAKATSDPPIGSIDTGLDSPYPVKEVVKATNQESESDTDTDMMEPSPVKEIIQVTGFIRQARVLSGEKMKAARKWWLYRPPETFKGLTIDQLLCLLDENHGHIPKSYLAKQELVDHLAVSVGFFVDDYIN
jgi:hypothetical protein